MKKKYIPLKTVRKIAAELEIKWYSKTQEQEAFNEALRKMVERLEANVMVVEL